MDVAVCVMLNMVETVMAMEMETATVMATATGQDSSHLDRSRRGARRWRHVEAAPPRGIEIPRYTNEVSPLREETDRGRLAA